MLYLVPSTGTCFLPSERFWLEFFCDHRLHFREMSHTSATTSSSPSYEVFTGTSHACHTSRHLGVSRDPTEVLVHIIHRVDRHNLDRNVRPVVIAPTIRQWGRSGGGVTHVMHSRSRITIEGGEIASVVVVRVCEREKTPES